MSAFFGVLAALALLALGIYFLPAPEAVSTGGILASLWLLAALVSAVAFGRELLLLIRLNRIRTRWRRTGKKLRRPSAATVSAFTRLRERERHLD